MLVGEIVDFLAVMSLAQLLVISALLAAIKY